MSKYKRLTERYVEEEGDFFKKGTRLTLKNAPNEEILERLAELEDKIENGTLIEIPCVRYNKERSCWQAIYEKMGIITTCNCGDEEMAKYKLDIEAQVKLKEYEK